MDFHQKHPGPSEIEFLSLIGYELKNVDSQWTWKSPVAMDLMSHAFERGAIDSAWDDAAFRILSVFEKTKQKLTPAEWYASQSGLLKSTFGVDSSKITFAKAAARILQSIKLTHHNQIVSFWRSLYFDPQPEKGFNPTQRAMSTLRSLRSSGSPVLLNPTPEAVNAAWDGVRCFATGLESQSIEFSVKHPAELVAVIPKGSYTILVHRHEGSPLYDIQPEAENDEDAQWYFRTKHFESDGQREAYVAPMVYITGFVSEANPNWNPLPLVWHERHQIEGIASAMEMLCDYGSIYSPRIIDPLALPDFPSTVQALVADYFSMANRQWGLEFAAKFEQRQKESSVTQFPVPQRERAAA